VFKISVSFAFLTFLRSFSETISSNLPLNSALSAFLGLSTFFGLAYFFLGCSAGEG